MLLNGHPAGTVEALIFDLDGTLVDSSAEIIKCLKQAYLDAGVGIDGLAFDSSLMGPPVSQIIPQLSPGLTEEQTAAIIAAFRQRYDNSEDDCSAAYEGTAQLLALLRGHGRRVFIATNKPMKATLRVLRALGMEDFDDVYTIDKLGTRLSKYEMISGIVETHRLDAARCLMVGDSPDDVRSGRRAGLFSVGALWGYGDKDLLEKESDLALYSVPELANLLATHLSAASR